MCDIIFVGKERLEVVKVVVPVFFFFELSHFLFLIG